MRVLFATYSLAFQNPGGGERVLLALQGELQALGHEVVLFDPWRHEVDRFDLIHFFSCRETSFWARCRERAPGVPFVVTPTLYLPEDPASVLSIRLRVLVLGGLEALGLKQLDRWSHLKLPDLWLPSTAAEARSLRRSWGIPREQIRVLRNGVDRQFLNPDPEPFRSRFGLPGRFALHVGRFHPVKNQKILIEAIRQAQAECIFLGDADPDFLDYHRECRDLAAKAQASDPTGRTRYHFIPALAHEDPLLASAYASAQVFVLPSQFETFGIAALEAAVAGCPLLLTDKMRSRDVFEEFATFVNPGDVGGLAAKIAEFLKAPRLSNHSPELFERFRWDAVGRELAEIYREVKPRAPARPHAPPAVPGSAPRARSSASRPGSN